MKFKDLVYFLLLPFICVFQFVYILTLRNIIRLILMNRF